MDVALSTSVSGMRAASIRLDIAANNIANVNTNRFRSSNAHQTDQFPQGARISSTSQDDSNPMSISDTDLVKESVEQIQNLQLFTANANILNSRDHILGSLLDAVA